jgi:hypothetical protein
VEKYRDRIIDRRVDARAAERHTERVAYARKVCQAVGKEHGLSAEVVAALALIGKGGPRDCGGPDGDSPLPLLPAEPIWRHRRDVGKAWVAALRAVAAPFYINIREEDDGLVIFMWGDTWNVTLGRVTPEGVEGIISKDAAVQDCVRRALTGPHKTVDGMGFAVFGSDLSIEIAIAAIAEVAQQEGSHA